MSYSVSAAILLFGLPLLFYFAVIKNLRGKSYWRNIFNESNSTEDELTANSHRASCEIVGQIAAVNRDSRNSVRHGI